MFCKIVGRYLIVIKLRLWSSDDDDDDDHGEKKPQKSIKLFNTYGII